MFGLFIKDILVLNYKKSECVSKKQLAQFLKFLESVTIKENLKLNKGQKSTCNNEEMVARIDNASNHLFIIF